MSSLRNSVQRRSHKERAQPTERSRLGLLEKKKDYQKRAKDYAAKKKVLKSLREKAADRNEDEFYYGMLSRKGPGSTVTRQRGAFDGTVTGDRGNRALDVDTVRLYKTQDLGTKAKRIVFCDAEEERDVVVEQAEGQQRARDEDDDDVMWEDEDDKTKSAEALRKEQNLEKLQKKLRAAKKRLKALADAEFELEVQKAKMAKTATSGGFTKGGQRIKVRERKR
ncbi:Utp11 protein-domain-containing protein [Echria macrotheca]|uniref:U3 small nucleolar RNA-associated protein 11 n=1 Tax=Echria macrotheca TaxID=438768 RepID=A0AAJ0FDQ0_9PEZI|nr:Utp11 protein-domain-containing protein [Echria macrotheca]